MGICRSERLPFLEMMRAGKRKHIAEKHFETPDSAIATAAASIVALSSSSTEGVKRRYLEESERLSLQCFIRHIGIRHTGSWVPAHPPLTPKTPKESRVGCMRGRCRERRRCSLSGSRHSGKHRCHFSSGRIATAVLADGGIECSRESEGGSSAS
jgi:hypothetical protein